MTDWRDGTLERTPVRSGDRVRIIAYGLGAARRDVGAEGMVIGFGRTRVKVHISAYRMMADLSIDPACLRVLPRGEK